ncbi:MAG: PQQ-binding-like beta-propeller repeat protein [Calditrichae bacterium]|nr:PQQ-binding-like beta-propeller repeat protein [Calditrichia bacterium]
MPHQSTVDINKDWVMLGRNYQRQHFSTQNIEPPLEIAWKEGVNSVVTDHPLAMGKYIFAPTKSGRLYLIDYNSGQGIGSGDIGPSLEHVPAIHQNIMYAGTSIGNETLIGFDLSRSKRVLSAKYPYINTSPLIWNDKIYFGTVDNLFICAYLETGNEIWRYETNGPIRSSPAFHKGTVVFGDDKGWLYAMDATSGAELWKKELNGTIYSHPVLGDSLVYVGTVSGTMYSLSLNTGKIKWDQSFSGSIYGSPALYKNILYFGNNAHEVIALHKDSGELIWKFKTKGIVNTAPLPSPDYLYVTSWDKHLYVLNRFSGKLVFEYLLDKPSKSSPIIYKEYLLVHAANNDLIAFANEQFIQARRKQK